MEISRPKPVFVYIITFKLNPKQVYVGKTGRALSLRWREHVRQSKKVNRRTGYLHRALMKHGSDAFVIRVAASFEDPARAKKYEKRLLRQLRERGFHPYNLTLGGEGSDPGWRMSAEVLALKSQAQKDRMSIPEHREKIADALRGRKRPAEVIAKISKARKGQPLSDEARQRQRLQVQARAASPEGREHLVRMATARWDQFRACGGSLVGQQFGSLTVEDRDAELSQQRKESVWVCRCSCTRVVRALGYNLRNGHNRTCGDKNCPERNRIKTEALQQAWATRRRELGD